jgi:hypothetical protein
LNTLKRSNQTQLSLHLLNTGNDIGTDGGNELAKELKSNASVTELKLAGQKICCFSF